MPTYSLLWCSIEPPSTEMALCPALQWVRRVFITWLQGGVVSERPHDLLHSCLTPFHRTWCFHDPIHIFSRLMGISFYHPLLLANIIMLIWVFRLKRQKWENKLQLFGLKNETLQRMPWCSLAVCQLAKKTPNIMNSHLNDHEGVKLTVFGSSNPYLHKERLTL